jgi:putative ABC transport system substrate-binding protein
MAASRIILFGPVPASHEIEPLLAALRSGLRESGDARASAVEVTYRGFTQDHNDSLLDIADEIDTVRPAVVVAWGYNCARVKGLTFHPPVVFVVNSDPAARSLVASQRLTGLTTWSPGAEHAQLALLRDLAPQTRRVAVVWDPSDTGSTRAFNETADMRPRFGFQRVSVEVTTMVDLQTAFAAAAQQDPDALCILSSPRLFVLRSPIARLAASHRLPATFDLGEFPEAGGLASYGGTLRQAFRRAAVYVDRILRGASPATLPVERLASPELVVNLRTARSLGLTIPEDVLRRAGTRLD